jgi:hypothetical protein
MGEIDLHKKSFNNHTKNVLDPGPGICIPGKNAPDPGFVKKYL